MDELLKISLDFVFTAKNASKMSSQQLCVVHEWS